MVRCEQSSACQRPSCKLAQIRASVDRKSQCRNVPSFFLVHERYDELSRKMSGKARRGGSPSTDDFNQKPKMRVCVSVLAARLPRTSGFTEDATGREGIVERTTTSNHTRFQRWSKMPEFAFEERSSWSRWLPLVESRVCVLSSEVFTNIQV